MSLREDAAGPSALLSGPPRLRIGAAPAAVALPEVAVDVRVPVGGAAPGEALARLRAQPVSSLMDVVVEGVRPVAFGPAGTGAAAFRFRLRGERCWDPVRFVLRVERAETADAIPVSIPMECPPAVALVPGDAVRFEGGDGDGVPEPGETVRIWTPLANAGRPNPYGIAFRAEGDRDVYAQPARDVGATLTLSGGVAVVREARWHLFTFGPQDPVAPFVVEIPPTARRDSPCEKGEDAPAALRMTVRAHAAGGHAAEPALDGCGWVAAPLGAGAPGEPPGESQGVAAGLLAAALVVACAFAVLRSSRA